MDRAERGNEMHHMRAVIAVLVLIGGLMLPGGDLYLAAPAAVIAAVLLHWEIVRTLPGVHWILAFIPVTFGLLAFHRLAVEPLTDYGDSKFFTLVTLTAFSAALACLVRPDGGFLALTRVWVVAALYLTAASLATGGDFRAAAFGANPIWVGRAMAVGLVFTAWLYWTRRLRLAWTLLAGLVLLVGLFAAGSRGPLLGGMAGVLVVFLASQVRTARKVSILLGLGVGALVLWQLPFVQESRIVGLATGEIVNDRTRNIMVTDTLRMIAEHPGGVGFGNWVVYSGLPSNFIYPHNLFLEVLAEHGVIVGLLFMALVAGVLVGVLRKARRSPVALGVTAWLVTEIVNVSVSGDLNARTFFFALTLAFLVAAHHEGTTTTRTVSSKATPRPARV